MTRRKPKATSMSHARDGRDIQEGERDSEPDTAQDGERETLSEHLTRWLVNRTGMWAHCEDRACRRGRCCRDVHVCEEKYGEIARDWFRRVMLPYLRERYPTVRWGSTDTHEQFKAALAAEEEEEARRQGRPMPPVAESRSKKQPVKRQPLYDPGDV